MASAKSSHDMWRGRDRQPPALGSPRPRYRSESIRLSDRRRPVKAVARQGDQCPGALHEGDAVCVYSRSSEKWVDGEVIKLMEANFVRVEYNVGECVCCKTLHLRSEHLYMHSGIALSSDDGFEKVDLVMKDAFKALCEHVTVNGSDYVAKVLDLEFVRNNSFATIAPLTMDCMIEYHGSFDEDVLLRIYALGREYPRKDYDRYELLGYIHAMQEPRMPVHVKAGYFVGLVMHRDLNEDWLWKMKKEDPEKYKNFISRSDPNGYAGRGDPVGKNSAQDADYLISFTTGNKEINDKILEQLSHQGVTFCTDRSLGFGGHFNAVAGLYLGKHGFGQPTAQGAWFEEYKRAADATKFGILIINCSVQYLLSNACLKEFFGIPHDRQWVLRDQHIVRVTEHHSLLDFLVVSKESYDAPCAKH